MSKKHNDDGEENCHEDLEQENIFFGRSRNKGCEDPREEFVEEVERKHDNPCIDYDSDIVDDTEMVFQRENSL